MTEKTKLGEERLQYCKGAGCGRQPHFYTSGGWRCSFCGEVEARDEGLEWALTCAISALENWGKHHSWCDSPGECSCGFSDQLRTLRAQLPVSS